MSFLQKPFYVMRHAQSLDNERGLISGAGSDPELSDLGLAQAEAAYAIFQGLNPAPQAVIASGLRRAQQTARLATRRVDVRIDPDLNERHLGELDGKISESEQKARKSLPGEESAAAHAIRVIMAVNRHLEVSDLPLFICHGGTIRRILEETQLTDAVTVGNAEIYSLIPAGAIWTISRPALD